MDPLGERRFVNYPPCLGVTYNHGGVVVDTNVYPNHPVARKLDNRIVGYNSEDENRLAILNPNERESDFTLREADGIKVKNQSIPAPVDKHFQDDFVVDRGAVFNERILAVYSTQVNVIPTICGCSGVRGSPPPLAHVFRAIAICGFNALLP